MMFCSFAVNFLCHMIKQFWDKGGVLMTKDLKILILARNSHQRRIDQTIKSLNKFKEKYPNMEIVIWSNISPTDQSEHVQHIKITENLRTLWEEDKIRSTLVLIDHINHQDMKFIRFLTEMDVPQILETKLVEKCKKYLPKISNMTYSYLHHDKLLVLIRRILFEQIEYSLDNFVWENKTDSEDARQLITNTTSVKWEGASKVDLVIINYNTLGYLKECIASIQRNTSYPYNLIVVDNGSNDGSVKYLAQFREITLIINKENLGFARACNQGIMAGEGEFVVILNSDIKVSSGWLAALVQTAKSDEMIGVVGPKMVNEKNQIIGAGVTSLNQFCSSRGLGEKDRPDLFDQLEDCYTVGGACYLIRRQALRKVGVFDENYFFYFEETDLSLRMLEKGYRVVYTPDVKIIHYHEGSIDKEKPGERFVRNRYFETSQQRFVDKWRDVLEGAVRREGTRDIVVFGIIPWNFRYQRPQQICSRLAGQDYRILYINNVCQSQSSLEKLHDNLYVLTVEGDGVVYNNLSVTQQRKILNSIYEVLARLKIYKPILWVDVPYWTEVMEHFDREMIVYNCMDSYTDFSDIQEFCPDLEILEQQLCEIADIVLASSQPLQEKLLKYTDNVICVPNGVDVNHFAYWKNWKIPLDLVGITQPIIGYYGAIAEWMDLELIDYLTEEMPDHSFVFIGMSTVDVEHLRRKANVYFLGEKSYAELPDYLQLFKIAIIPFKKNQLSFSTNPVKLYEYLAAGKPVVSVDLPEIRQFEDVVYIAGDYEEFLFYLKQIDDSNQNLERPKRLRAVEGNDWHNRVRIILKAVGKTKSVLTQQSLLGKMRKLIHKKEECENISE